MNRRRVLSRIGLVLLSLLALSACTATPPSPTPAPPKPAESKTGALTTAPAEPAASPEAKAAEKSASKPAGPLTKIRYGATSVLSTYWEDFVADAKGLWAANGLELETTLTQTSAGGTQALLSDSIEISDHSVDSVILAVERGADLLHVADTVVAPVYSLVATRELRSYTDLKGKNIAISDLRSGPTIILKRMLAANGVKENEVNLIQSGGTPARVAALESGAAQAALLIQPFDFQLLDKGYTLIGYSTDVVKKQTFNAVIVRRPWAERNSDTLVRFLRAKKQAIDWLYDPGNREEAIRIFASRTNSPPDIASRTYDLIIGKIGMFSRDLGPDPEGLQDVIDTLGTLGDLKEPLPKPQKYFDSRYAEMARKGG